MLDTQKYKKLLYIHGFTTHPEHKHWTVEERTAHIKRFRPGSEPFNELLNHVELDKIENSQSYFVESPYPKSASHYRLVHENPNSSLEEGYFWVLEHLRVDRGFFDIIKITDSYASTEASAFWGNQQQRLGAQQGQAQGLLANIGKFVKELFQMVRELRIIDERLDAYENWQKSPSADVTLKSIFTDQVEGGTKNPQSVFGLAQSVGFTILPDIFFSTRVYDKNTLDQVIEGMHYNTNIKNVLRRKLYQFIVWKEQTHKELKNRRTFNIRYLHQHWAIIKLYMQWAKPYLKNVQRLQMQDGREDDPELISSFDNNLSEIEIIAKKPPVGANKAGKGGFYPVLVITFTFRTRPEMAVRKEYQQGPAHMGRLQMDFRSYSWTDEEIQNYKKMRDRETIELLGILDTHLNDVMDALGDDFQAYIDERIEEDKYEEEEKKKTTKQLITQLTGKGSALEPFTAVFGGFGEIFGSFVTLPKKKGKTKQINEAAKAKALGEAKSQLFLMWHIYKKAHRLLSW